MQMTWNLQYKHKDSENDGNNDDIHRTQQKREEEMGKKANYFMLHKNG